MEKFLLSCLFFAIVSFTQAQEIKILSYNIFHGENPAKPGDSTFHYLADWIILNQPEVVALQEVDSMTLRSERIYGKKINYMQKMSLETGYRSYFGKAMNFDEGGYGEGLLAKKGSKYHTLPLPNPAGGEPRAAAWVMGELKTLEEFYFGATHLCHEFEENRLAQVDSLFSYADSLNRPVVIAGDFNFKPASPEYSSIPSHWKEAGAVAGDTTYTYGTPEEGGRIDFVWYDSRKFDLVEYKVLTQITYSDHYPVWVVLRIRKPEE